MPKQHSNKIQQEVVERYKDGESATKIAKSMGLYTTSVTRVLKRRGVAMRTHKGKNHPMWKGGRHKKYGYVKIWMPEHPRANNIGYVSEHVLVAERIYKRPIKKSENVHHIDFTRDNNKPDNLWVANNKDHHIAERSIQRLVKPLLERGVIKFNRKKGIYEI